MRAVLRATLAALTALVAASCLSPTLPLPPPAVPDAVMPSDDGTEWTISGPCIAGATVFVGNHKTGQGVWVEDRTRSGRYVVVLAGAKCDLAYVKQEASTEDSLDTSAETGFVLAADLDATGDSQSCH